MSGYMGTYFEDGHDALRYPVGGTERAGLRVAQRGAIHALAAHFTVRSGEPTLVVMPTGSGKTAVLMMSAFVERAGRVLVVTPSVLVRGQIRETLSVLKRVGALGCEVGREILGEISSPPTSSPNFSALSGRSNPQLASLRPFGGKA